MGKLGKPQRSKKHKKIKSVDPFYKGDRGNQREAGLNQKPKVFTQEVPKKLRELSLKIEDVKKGRVGKKSRNKFITTPDGPQKYTNHFKTPLGMKAEGSHVNSTESKTKRDLHKKESSTESKAEKKKKGKKGKWKVTQAEIENYVDNLKPTRPLVKPFQFKQGSDETDAAFMRRVDEETKKVLTKSKIDDKFDISDMQKMKRIAKQKATGMNQKRKDRLKEKKKKKTEALKAKKREKDMDFNQLQDKVEFGDVVHAPPVLSVRPKKASVISVDKPGRRMPELQQAIDQNVKEGAGDVTRPSTMIQRETGRTLKRKAMTTQEKQFTDLQRDNFIDAYRLLKSKKRKIK